MLWDDHEVQDNYAGGAPDGGLPPNHHYSKKRQAAGLQGLLRDDALLAAGGRAQPHLPPPAVRAHRRPADHGPAPVPRQPAVRRRDRRPGLRGLRPAAHLPRHAPDELAQDASSTARRRPGRSWPTRSRSCRPASSAAPSSASTAGTGYPQERESLLDAHPRSARSRTSSSSPATSTPSSPATCAPPRAPATRPRSSSSAARSPPRGSARPTCRPAAGWSSRATTRTRTPTRRSSTR